MYNLYRLGARGGNMIWSDSHQWAVFLVQFGIYKRHLLVTDNIPFPQACNACQEWPGNLIEPMIVAFPRGGNQNQDQDGENQISQEELVRE